MFRKSKIIKCPTCKSKIELEITPTGMLVLLFAMAILSGIGLGYSIAYIIGF